MVQYREIPVKEALNMIADGEINNVYFELNDRSIGCVNDYKTSFTQLPKHKYFKKEEIN